MIAIVFRADMTGCVRWEIIVHDRSSGVWLCAAFGRVAAGADPTDLGRAVLPVCLAGRLADAGWKADPAICRALPPYLRNALA